LLTQKQADFLLFKSIIDTMNRKEHLSNVGFQKILNLKASLNRGLSHRSALKVAFPNTIPVQRPTVKNDPIFDPNWLAGFVNGEGCFECSVSKSKTHTTGHAVKLKFTVGQHSRDTFLLNKLVNYFGCGLITSTRDYVRFYVTSLKDISKTIIPFFEKYPLQGAKKDDFYDFCEAAKLMNNQSHLTTEGLAQIQNIKSRMNSNRI
jgi:hypothetical protein